MYQTLLTVHSLMRWLVLAALLVSICRGLAGMKFKKAFSRADDSVRHWTATIVHVQLVIGLWLYGISPVISYFLHNYRDAVHLREVRFFGMEHSLMMVIAVAVITIGSARSKRKTTDREKFRTMVVWYAAGLLIILTSIPWSFSPFAARPLFRSF